VRIPKKPTKIIGCFKENIQLLADCKNALKILFPLSESEQAFLESLFERGLIEATLITQDRILIEKINSHPLLQWKAQLVSKNNQK
jgi:hypothetical protein